MGSRLQGLARTFDVYLQCLTTLVTGGNGLSRPGGNLGLNLQGLGFEAQVWVQVGLWLEGLFRV